MDEAERLLAAGEAVVAVGLDARALGELSARHPDAALALLVGDPADPDVIDHARAMVLDLRLDPRVK